MYSLEALYMNHIIDKGEKRKKDFGKYIDVGKGMFISLMGSLMLNINPVGVYNNVSGYIYKVCIHSVEDKRIESVLRYGGVYDTSGITK